MTTRWAATQNNSCIIKLQTITIFRSNCGLCILKKIVCDHNGLMCWIMPSVGRPEQFVTHLHVCIMSMTRAEAMSKIYKIHKIANIFVRVGGSHHLISNKKSSNLLMSKNNLCQFCISIIEHIIFTCSLLH